MQNFEVIELINNLPKAFLPEKAVGLNVSIGIHAEGDNGGDWEIKIRDQEIKIIDEKAINPDLFLSSDTKTILGIFTGEIDEMKAFMKGDIQFKGSMGLAMKLTKLFSLNKDLLVG